MTATATFSTDAASLSAVFAAWFAANPDLVSIDAPVEIAGEGVRIQAGPRQAPAVALPSGSFSLSMSDYAVQAFAIDDGKTGERLFGFTLGVTLTATAAISGHTLSLSGVTGQLRYDGEHSEIIDGALNYLLGELVGRGRSWPLPQLDRLMGLKATLESVGTHDGTLAAVVGMSCEPKAPVAERVLVAPGQDFRAQITASATDDLVQDVITCVFRPVRKSEHTTIGDWGLEARLEVSIELETPQIKFQDGRIRGTAAARASATVNGKGPNERVSLSVEVTPKLTHGGQHVSLVLSLPKQDVHLPVPVPGFLKPIKGLIEDGISKLLNLVIEGLNKLLEKAPIPLFELDNPYAVFDLDVHLAFGALGVQGDSLVTQVVATTHVDA